MKTIKQFAEKSHVDASLIRAVVRQIGGWEEFKDHAEDVCDHGASGGFSGFTYYSDTVAFTKRNKAAILDFCKQYADDFDNSGVIDLIASFRGMKGETQEDIADGLYNPRSDNRTTVYNILAWFALEEVARAYCDSVEG